MYGSQEKNLGQKVPFFIHLSEGSPLHDHLRSVMSMHFWRFFLLHFLKLFCIFWVNWTKSRSSTVEKNSKKFSVEVAPKPL